MENSIANSNNNGFSLSIKESRSKAKELFNTKEGSYLLEHDRHLLILFINPISGSQEGKIIHEIALNNRDKDIEGYLIVHFPNEANSRLISINTNGRNNNNEEKENDNTKANRKEDAFSVIVFNILNEKEYNDGIVFIFEFLNITTHKLRILIGGGDGTVLRLVEYLNSFNIDLTRCYFGHIPLGTGNDLSNAMGFGNVVKLSNKLSGLHRVLYTYITAQECKIDIWKTTLYMKENGCINVIQDDSESSMNEQNGQLKKTMIKTFINYFSIGFDARVGFNFEQRRSASRTCNKMIYCWEAAKRYLCCKKNISLTSILEAFHSIDDNKANEVGYNTNANNGNGNNRNKCLGQSSSSEIELARDSVDDNQCQLLPPDIDDSIKKYNSNRKRTIFRTFHKQAKEFDKVTLRGNPVDIICQNINFYMGGTMDIWENSSHIGLKLMTSKEQSLISYSNTIKSHFNDQRYDDKKLEFFTYDTGLAMAMERIAAGQADKIYQGKGPMIITFKQQPSNDEDTALNKVYYNVDGEFFHLLQPKELHIELNEDINYGQINFLRNED